MKITKYLLSVAIATGAFFTVGQPFISKAAMSDTTSGALTGTIDTNNMKQPINTYLELQTKIVNELQKDNPLTLSETESSLSDFYDRHIVNSPDIESNEKENILPYLKKGEGSSKNKPINLNNYIAKNIKDGNFFEKKINDNVSIIFTDNLNYFLDITEETPALSSASSQSPLLMSAAAFKNTSTKTHTYVAKGAILGQTLFKVSVKGYFSYNHSSVTPHLTDAWYTRGILSIWQVQNWKEGHDISSAHHGEIYGEGNFNYGFEYSGIGLVVEELHIKVYIRGDKNGKTWSGTSKYS